MITILIADDQSTVQQDLRAELETHPDLILVGDSNTADEAVQLARALHPMVVLLDAKMPGMGGIAAAKELQGTLDTRVIVYSLFDDPQSCQRAHDAGAIFVSKHEPVEMLLSAIYGAPL